MGCVTCGNALIKGYVRGVVDTWTLFACLDTVMQDEVNVRADEITVLSVVVACAHLGALDMGRSGSTPTLGKNRMRISVSLATSLIEMYAKCGETDEAVSLLSEMPEPERDVTM